MTLTLYLHQWQWLATGPGIEATGHLDDGTAWGDLAYRWRSRLRQECAPWVLAALEVHDRYIHGRPDADRCQIVCAGLSVQAAQMIHRGDWTGTDLERHVALLRASPGILACRKLGKGEADIIARRGATAHQLAVVSEDGVLASPVVGLMLRGVAL